MTMFGILPSMLAKTDKKNRGFALGILPGLAYKNYQEGKEEDKKDKLVSGMKKGGSVKSASARADGCAIKGKTRGKII